MSSLTAKKAKFVEDTTIPLGDGQLAIFAEFIDVSGFRRVGRGRRRSLIRLGFGGRRRIVGGIGFRVAILLFVFGGATGVAGVAGGSGVGVGGRFLDSVLLTNFFLAFPVTMINLLGELTHCGESFGLSDAGDLVFEAGRKV